MSPRLAHVHRAPRCIFVALLTAFVSTVLSGLSGAHARLFPDTAGGIHVFADQIPPGNTDAQNRFAAERYVGTQKMIPDDIALIRAYNPDFLHLHYKLAVGQGDSTILFIDGNEWVTDWGYVQQQDDWFVTDSTGTRIRHAYWGWYLMDVSGQISGAGDDGWKEYWADTCIDQMRHNSADGVFADSYDVAVVNAWYLDPPDWRFEGTNPNTYWVPHLDLFGHYLAERLHAEPEGFYLLPNLGLQVTSWDEADYAFGDGGMIEGFAQWGGDDPFGLSDWTLQMNRILALIAQDKIMILQSYLQDELDYDDRMFYTGCYLLVKGHHTYLNILAHGPGLDMQYYPEYTIDLGPYLHASPGEIGQLLDPETGVYRRPYENGLVLVNPTATPRAVALESPRYRVTASGGGVVDEAGHYGGSLDFVAVQEVALGPYEARILVDEPPQPEGQATDLAAFHRGGQTFLTWTELAPVGESYRLYRHDQPITESTLSQASRIAEVAEGSAFYANEASRPGALHQNFIIEDLGPELPDGTGLLVWTPHESAPAYYAVTAVVDGLENLTLSDANSLPSPVPETDDPPAPVLVWQADSGRGWVFTQFMDYAAWNPTFDGYAYNYSVGVPSNYDPAAAFPLTVHLDGWGTRYATLTGSPYEYQTIYVSVDDPHQTWYFGHALDHDYDQQGPVPAAGRIANLTEWRILRSVYDAISDPRFTVDENRIYVFGGSMGGSGTLAFATRYPDVFAAAYAVAPMTNYQTCGTYGGTPWPNDLIPKWGALEDNLPVFHTGPYAEHLAPHDDTGVWDWMNHQATMSGETGRLADEMPYLATAHGNADWIIEWPSQGEPWYAIMDEQARRGFSGYVLDGADHYWYGFVGCGPNLPFEAYVFRKDRSFPGLTGCTLNTEFDHNRGIEWSCPWHDFAGDIVDTADHYELALRIVGSSDYADSATVDITPRRLQAFEIAPGQAYTWRNETLAGELIAAGEGEADAYGLVLIDDFLVTKVGTRLVLDSQPVSSVEGADPNLASDSGDARDDRPGSGPVPGELHLAQPHPNPFGRGNVRLRFAVPATAGSTEPAVVTVAVYDVRGRLVRTLRQGRAPSGWHEAVWDGRDHAGRTVPAGVYWVRLRGDGAGDARSLIRVE